MKTIVAIGTVIISLTLSSLLADAAKPLASIKVSDAKVTINFPSSYKNKTYTIEDGHYTFKKGKLNNYGNAVVDLKKITSFRKAPNSQVLVLIQGSTKSPYFRNTNIKRTSGASYLMFKEEFDATRDFDISATYSADGYTKKLKQGKTLLKKDDVVGMEYSYMTNVKKAKYIGSKHKVYAYTTTKQKPENGPDIIDAKGEFIFNGQFYSSIILR